MANERCETCCFWLAYPPDDGSAPTEGMCRRFPPIPIGKTHWPGYDEDAYIMASTEWPDTDAEDWCGEWRPMDREGGA